jgi:hypothetical protein
MNYLEIFGKNLAQDSTATLLGMHQVVMLR